MRRIKIYIHERSDWPRWSWKAESVSTMLAAVRHRQGRLLGQMESLGFDLQSETHVTMLTQSVVKSSAIEGEILNPSEVRSSLARQLGLPSAGLPRPGRAVEGVVEMMLDATRHFAQPLSQERLFSWHAALFPTGRSGIRRITVGAWRTPEAGPMQVVSGAIGREKVHFEAPAAARIEPEMNQLISWFNAESPLDPVLKAALAHVWFVTIHPFEDGNGRIARALTDLLLARADGLMHRFYSMSTQIEAEREQYYDVLESTQCGNMDITPWLTWFLSCLDRALAGAENTLDDTLHKARLWQVINHKPVNARQQLVVNRLLDHFQGVLTTSKYAKLAKCSADTALRDIQELLSRKILVKNSGGGRSTSYRLNEPQLIPK